MLSSFTKENPFLSQITERYLLNKEGSLKKTYHIELDIHGSSLSCKVGDSIGVLPFNPPELVTSLLFYLEGKAEQTISDPRKKDPISLFDYLSKRVNLQRVSSSLCKQLFPYLKAEKKQLLSSLEKTPSLLQSYLKEYELFDFLEDHAQKKIPLESLLSNLALQLPRFYSIASSPLLHPDSLHLTVNYINYQKRNLPKAGVASHFLCQAAPKKEKVVPIFLLPTSHFTLPCPTKDIIMIGPGTGVAPFRGFLQQRIYQKAPGRNWLFFGEQKKAYDFYYEDFFSLCEKQNFLTLSTAFSRDQPEKIYVQQKIWEHRKELWSWMQQGAYLYLCGDAKQMAKEVEKAFLQIFTTEGNFTEEEAKAFLKYLKKEKRYLLDVY